MNITDLLMSMPAKERQEFELFLSSPYFNRGKKKDVMVHLFQILSDSNFGEGKPQLSRQETYERLFPGHEWVERKLEKLLVDLNKLLRSFFMIRHYSREENEFQQQLDLGAIFQARGLEDRHQQQLLKLKSIQDAYPWKNADFFFRQFQLEYAVHEFETLYNRRKSDLNIPQVLHNLDIFYHLHRLQQLNIFLLQQKMAQLGEAKDIAFGRQGDSLPDNYLQASTYLIIQEQIYKLFNKPDPTVADFQHLTALLTQNELVIEKKELEQFYACLRNLCVILINSGARELLPALHQIQRDNLIRGFLYPSDKQDKLTPSACLNIVSVALRVQNFDWVRDFLEQHRDRIIGDNETKDFYRFNLACYLFAIGNFDKALDYIPPSSPYIDYHLMARRLEIKIYFETGSDLLTYKADAFKMYVSRASQKFLSQELRRKNADFVNLVIQIMQSVQGDEHRAQRLTRRILEKTGVAEQDWLLSKVKNLE